MNTKHTPGKWEYLKVGNVFHVKSSDTTQVVCEVHDEHIDKTGESNAKLIAAAPCLLEALQIIESDCGRTLDYATIGNICRTAITKATQP